MNDLAKRAVSAAVEMGAEYADARITTRKTETITVRNGLVDSVLREESLGMGIRVIVNGAWGFASNPDMNQKKTDIAVKRAVDTAKAASAFQKNPVILAPVEIARGTWKSPRVRDPYRISYPDKLGLLMECDTRMDKAGKTGKLSSRAAFLSFHQEYRFLVTSEGTQVEQDVLHSGGGLQVIAADANDIQIRSWPSSFRGHLRMGGYEFIESLNMPDQCEKTVAEAMTLLTSPQCEPGRTDLILGGSQLALQVHESCGHPVELDRVFGMEADYAGRSFLTPDKLGKFRYGSDLVNLTADATFPGLGGHAWDDEGVPGKRVPLVEKGIFVGYLTSRETAAQLNLPVTGAMRAEDWHSPPLIRMTNINLEPGDMPLQAIIETTENGLLMTENSSWSIDDFRLNFQFSAECGWLIKNGKIVGMVRNPSYTGITPEFWGKCDAISDEATWELWGTPNCGKGQPSQTMRVGHGVPYARFRDIQVGVDK